jgi:hypothetical protein
MGGLLDPESWAEAGRRAKGLLAEKYEEAMGILGHPRAVYEGKADPYDPGMALGMAGMAMTGGIGGAPKGAIGSGPIPRYLHGTTADNVPSIRQNYLRPGVSDYTKQFYGDDIPEALFLTPEDMPGKAFSSIRGQIAKKLGKHPSEVTAQEIREHGAMILAREDPYEMYRYTEEGTAKNPKGGYTDDIPPQAEPGDVFATDDIAPTGILKGERLVRYLQKQGLVK